MLTSRLTLHINSNYQELCRYLKHLIKQTRIEEGMVCAIQGTNSNFEVRQSFFKSRYMHTWNYNPALNISTRIALEIYNNNLKLYLICLANIVHSCIYKWLAIGSIYNLCYICLVDILIVYNHSVWNIWIEKRNITYVLYISHGSRVYLI